MTDLVTLVECSDDVFEKIVFDYVNNVENSKFSLEPLALSYQEKLNYVLDNLPEQISTKFKTRYATALEHDEFIHTNVEKDILDEIEYKFGEEYLDVMKKLVRSHILTKWETRMMNAALLISTWSSCLRRQVGAVIEKDKRIMTTGYNGAPSGITSCVDKKYCNRGLANVSSGTHHELCYAIHAEQNAILQAAKIGLSLEGSTIYCTHKPCSLCAKSIINAGIKTVVYLYEYPDRLTDKLFKEANINYKQGILITRKEAEE